MQSMLFWGKPKVTWGVRPIDMAYMNANPQLGSVMGEHDPFAKIRKYLEEQAKMPYVATNIAAKPVSWPGQVKATDQSAKPVGDTFPGAPSIKEEPPSEPAVPEEKCDDGAANAVASSDVSSDTSASADEAATEKKD